MKKTLFLCSRMEPFGMADLRADLAELHGGTRDGGSAFRLHVEGRELREGEDARMFCARSIMESDAVVLVLDGSGSMARNPFDAPVLELEVMLATTAAKPVLVIDGSDGQDPLYRLLGSEFFGEAVEAQARVLPLRGASPKEKASRLRGVLAGICDGQGPGASALSEPIGWERLFLRRPDRLDSFEEDGGNFPFATRGLDVPDLTSREIDALLERAEAAYESDKMAALVLTWDAVRALSRKPWAATSLDRTTALLWLRALSLWGRAMAWLGLFGHSSGAAVMSILACWRLASRLDVAQTTGDGPYAPHKFLGGLASTYFSLAERVASRDVQRAMRKRGIGHSTEALGREGDARARAGLLAVRGSLWMSTRSAQGVIRGFADLRESVGLHRGASGGNERDPGLATARIQLGAAYKEVAKRTFRNSVALRRAHYHLRPAYEALNEARSGSEAVDGQLLMCMKHLVETLWLLGRESEAHELWRTAVVLATKSGITDQLRQLRDIGRRAGWEAPPPPG